MHSSWNFNIEFLKKNSTKRKASTYLEDIIYSTKLFRELLFRYFSSLSHLVDCFQCRAVIIGPGVAGSLTQCLRIHTFGIITLKLLPVLETDSSHSMSARSKVEGEKGHVLF